MQLCELDKVTLWVTSSLSTATLVTMETQLMNTQAMLTLSLSFILLSSSVLSRSLLHSFSHFSTLLWAEKHLKEIKAHLQYNLQFNCLIIALYSTVKYLYYL